MRRGVFSVLLSLVDLYFIVSESCQLEIEAIGG